MSRKIKVIPLVMGIYLLTLIFCPITYAVDGVLDSVGMPTRYGGHKCVTGSGPEKQVCANCHLPHGGKGKKIWSGGVDKTNKELKKIEDLCRSCHYLPNDFFQKISSGLRPVEYLKNGEKTSGYGNVFLEGGVNHVMDVRGQIGKKVKGLHTTKADVSKEFPFDADDEGFYCGSCHNPHKQPLINGKPDETGNGDYLRIDPSKPVSAGLTHDRTQFCNQCHIDFIQKQNHYPGDHCESCHYPPHSGYPDSAKFPFYHSPSKLVWCNVNLSTESRGRYIRLEKGRGDYKSDSCAYPAVGCHRTGNPKDAPQIRADHGNHPMGRKWADTSCAVSGCHSKNALPVAGLFRLDGYQSLADPDGELIDPYWQATALPFDQQRFDCLSCHSNHGVDDSNVMKEVKDNPRYLLYADFKNDNTVYCERCHGGCKASPKKASLLSGLHYKTRNDTENYIKRTFKATETKPEETVKCGGCMFCHFIHLDKDDPRDVPKSSWASDNPGTFIRADINALMRVPPKAIDWDDQGVGITLISDKTARYEAMCYGCHGDPAIVGPYGENGGKGSLLNPAGKGFFSHRFACAPSSANTSNTKANISVTPLKDGKFPYADGTPGAAGGVMDDYGTVAGQFYCGSCHDVHNNQKPPYLYKLSPRDIASPYMSDSIKVPVKSRDARDGFCEQCHCATDNADPMAQGTTHPVGKDADPDPLKTAIKFPVAFSGRYELKLPDNGGGSPYGLTYLNRGSQGGVICLTCHNVHAASTSWDGMVNSGSTKVHGKLLVMDNYKNPETGTGSDMCGACHDEFFKQ